MGRAGPAGPARPNPGPAHQRRPMTSPDKYEFESELYPSTVTIGHAGYRYCSSYILEKERLNVKITARTQEQQRLQLLYQVLVSF